MQAPTVLGSRRHVEFEIISPLLARGVREGCHTLIMVIHVGTLPGIIDSYTNDGGGPGATLLLLEQRFLE